MLVNMMRHTKANVDIAVLPREELTLFIPMTEAQKVLDLDIFNTNGYNGFKRDIYKRGWPAE